jgi:hypothetical protein
MRRSTQATLVILHTPPADTLLPAFPFSIISSSLFSQFFVLTSYLGCPTVSYRNPLEISLANFTVKASTNHLERSVAGGIVESGALQTGSIKQTNATLDTETGTWNTTVGGVFDQMFIVYASTAE